MNGRRRGRPLLESPKERVGVRIPRDIFDVYDAEERRSGIKATTYMARVLTLHAQSIIRLRKLAKGSGSLH